MGGGYPQSFYRHFSPGAKKCVFSGATTIDIIAGEILSEGKKINKFLSIFWEESVATKESDSDTDSDRGFSDRSFLFFLRLIIILLPKTF